MPMQFVAVQVLDKPQQRVNFPLADCRSGPLWLDPSDAHRQIGSQPLVTAGDDEVGPLETVVDRHLAECLSGIDEAEVDAAASLNCGDDLTDWQPHA